MYNSELHFDFHHTRSIMQKYNYNWASEQKRTPFNIAQKLLFRNTVRSSFWRQFSNELTDNFTKKWVSFETYEHHLEGKGEV